MTYRRSSRRASWHAFARARLVVLICLVVLLSLLAACGGSQNKTLILATTTSTQDSGLLDLLVPAFETADGYKVKTVAVGSGQAIAMGERGEADVLLVHSPAAESALMATGKAARRLLVMHNDFVLVGPPADPAHVNGSGLVAALRAIGSSRSVFLSRGDASGTNAFELKAWKAAGVAPAGSWYQKTGQGMGATLQVAAQKRAYTITDRGTWLATGNGKGLQILVQNDPGLLNIYHVIPISRKAGSKVNEKGADAFAKWITSAAAQTLIGGFGNEKYGRALFTADAGKSDQQVQKAG